MKIVVNTRLLRRNQMDGIGWFSYHTLSHIVRNNPSVEFHFLFDSGVDQAFLFGQNVIPHNLFPPARHAILNIAWFEWAVKRALNRINPDLFFSPDGILCMGWNGRQHGVIHDISFRHRPEDLKWTNNKYYNYFFPRFAKRAARIATISEYSKADICRSFQVDPAKVDVVYGGGNEVFQPISLEEQQLVRQTFTSGKPYFIFVGTLHPRKNLVALLKAFELFKEETGSDYKIVLAGKPAYKAADIFEQRNIMKHKEDVIFTGRVDDDKLNGLLGAAFASTFVPHFEGFGIPIIEAMQCDVPVISSNTTSMPEVAGDAALLVNPEQIGEIKSAMVKLYTDTGLRTLLVERGRERRNLFTWEKTASALWKSLQASM